MAGRFASDDRGSRDGRGRTGAARAPLHRWLAVPVGLRARTAVERGASCGSSASVVGTDADAAAVADACLGETSSRHPVRGVHDAAPRRWVLVSAVRAARRSRLATACAALARSACATGDRAPTSAAWAWAWPSSSRASARALPAGSSPTLRAPGSGRDAGSAVRPRDAVRRRRGSPGARRLSPRPAP